MKKIIFLLLFPVLTYSQVNVLSGSYVPHTGTPFTVTTGSSADWGGVSNSTYFYDLTAKIVYFKNSSGGVVSTIFSGNAELPLTFSTGLTRTSNTITANLATGISGGQSVIGGTGVSDALTLKGTTGNGTSSSAAIVGSVGNNGATNAFNIYNDGTITNNYAVKFNDGTGQSIFRQAVGTAADPALYMFNNQSGTPSSTNYILKVASAGSGNTYLNGNAIVLQQGGTSCLLITNGLMRFTPSSTSTNLAGLDFIPTSPSTLSPASVETRSFVINTATIGHATGAISTNRFMVVNAPTYSFAGASTITDAVTFEVTAAPIAGTNATITNPWAARLLGNVAIGTKLYIGSATGTVAPTQALDVAGNVQMNTAGNGLYIKEGTNATSGTGTLVGGTVVISTTKVTANSRIYVFGNGGVITNIGTLYNSARTAGTSFTITSTNALDTETFAWLIIEPAP